MLVLYAGDMSMNGKQTIQDMGKHNTTIRIICTTQHRKLRTPLLGIIYKNLSFESSLDQGFKKLSLNDVASFVAQLWCLKAKSIIYPLC